MKIYWIAIFLFIGSCSEKKEIQYDFATGNYLQRKISKNFHLHIQRYDTIQAEINMNTKEVSLFKIDWINSKLYTLTALNKDSILSRPLIRLSRKKPE